MVKEKYMKESDVALRKEDYILFIEVKMSEDVRKKMQGIIRRTEGAISCWEV